MKVLGVALLLCVRVILAQGQVAPECTYGRESYYPNIWISAPPLLIEDTSLTVYLCSDSFFFNYAYYYGTSATMTAAIREASTPNASTWNYTESFISCYDYECRDLYTQNFTNSLVALHMFTSLKPNTLYSLELLGCYLHYGTCTVGNSRFRYSVNITTRPEAPQFQWLTTAETIQIYFQADYYTGAAPDGHEVLIWQKTGAASPSTAPALSHYFPLSTLNATVEGLLPNTEYFLYVRANGTHFANNQGSWVRREVNTRPLDPPIPQLLQYIERDTAVLLKLLPSLLASGVVSCLVELVSPASGLNTTSFLNHTTSDLDGGLSLFVEGLVPNQEYSLRLAAVNEAGVSRFTEWVNFTTTSAVVHSAPSDAGGALMLQWTLPTLFDGDSLLQYEVTLTPLGVGSAVQVRFTLPAPQSELTAQGLQEGVEYQVMIETRVDLGLVQPFYSTNVTIPVAPAPASSAAVANGVAGAGVTLLIVLVCGAVVGVLLLVAFLKWRKGGSEQTRKERSSLQRNISGMCDEVTMKANPAYGAVEFDVGEGADPQRYEARYHSQEDVVDQLRGEGGCKEGDGLRVGAGLGCDEPTVEVAEGTFYENITR